MKFEEAEVLLFSIEKFSEMTIFNSVVGVFFGPEIAHDAKSLQVCRVVGVLYNTCLGCHRGSEVGGGGFKSRFRPYFLRLFGYSLTRSYFLTKKLGFLGQKFMVFW